MFLAYEVKPQYISKAPKKRGPQIGSSADIFAYALPLWEETADMEIRERFLAVYLSRANRVICHEWISIGGTCGTVVDMKLVALTAVKSLASNVIFAHNHPSGNLKPSDADIRLTQKAIQGLRLLDFCLLDHCILAMDDNGEPTYFSFADQGILE